MTICLTSAPPCSFKSTNKPGILIGNLFAGKFQSLEVKATGEERIKVNSILCTDCGENDRVSVIARNLRSSFYGNIISSPRCFTRDSCIVHNNGRRFVVSSVFGRKVSKKQTVIPDADYRIPIILLGLAGGLAYSNNTIPAVPVGLLGLLLLFQTTRVRFVFDDDSLEVKVGDELQDSGENAFVGGKNRWKYSSFVNWELWWPSFPILVYFKETQTKPEGQIHFFPVIFNGKQLYDVMVERAGPSKTSGPK